MSEAKCNPDVINSILKTEFSPEFIRLMQNRMVVSYYKYGPIKTNLENRYTDTMASLEKRLQKYRETGNTEWLIDVANMCMMEFMYPQHPKAHFRATDSNESPGVVGLPINLAKEIK